MVQRCLLRSLEDLDLILGNARAVVRRPEGHAAILGFDANVDDAVSRAEQTLENLIWVSMVNQAVELDQPECEYQAEIEVAFEHADGVGE